MGPGELLDLFAQEAAEMVRELEQGLILLERSPRDAAILNRVFRAAHTIKGNAGIVGLETLAELTHAMESLLDAIRKGRVVADEPVISALLAGLDLVRSMVDDIRAPLPSDRLDLVRKVQAQIVAHASQVVKKDAEAATPEPGPPTPANPGVFDLLLQFHPDVMESGHDPLVLIDELAAIGTLESVLADFGKMPEFRSMDVRRVYVSWRIRMTSPRGKKVLEDLFAFLPGGNRIEIRDAGQTPVPVQSRPKEPEPARPRSTTPAPQPMPQTPVPAPASRPPETPSTSKEPDFPEPQSQELSSRTPDFHEVESPVLADKGGKSETVRVAVRVLDRLMTLAGEMVLTRNQLVQSTRSGDLRLIERVTQRVDLLTAELQDAIMATRMQSIRVVFDKFTRTVRDLSRDLGKRVRLVIEDEGVELDKTIIEAISDPLSHLVRNAVDHGIESPEKRQAAGKPPEGTIRLRAWHGAGQVMVDVTDDGQGIDPEAVKARAVSLGLIRPEDARGLSAKAARDLIFLPGLTTATQVSKVSGRGVGLDVVLSNLSAIGGTIQTDSTPGRGTSFRIRFPLTLAILPSLLVEVEGERFAIPQVNLVELVRVRPSDIRNRLERLAGVDVIRARGELLPIIRLRDLLGIDTPTYLDPETGERRLDRRINLADRRGRAEGGDPENGRRQGPDRRTSNQSAVNLAIVSSGDYTYGLVVDSLLDSVEIVVKPLGHSFHACQTYAGATVMGDGRAALILDVVGLGRKAWIAEKAEIAAATQRGRDAAGKTEEVEKVAMLLVEGGDGELFGMPLDRVERIRKVSRQEIQVVGGRRVLRGTRTTLPVLALDQVIPATPLPELDTLHVVMLKAGSREVGLLASQVVDIVEVESDFDTVTHRQTGIHGTTIFGERVLVVLDLSEIVSAILPERREEAARTRPDGKRKPRMLVVEDSPFFLNHVATIMEEAGYAVSRANNGAVGLDMLTKDPDAFDIVVTDIEMPEMNGFEMVERMRKHPVLRKIPVVAVTSLLSADARQRGRDVGIDEYSVKLDRDDVLERCRRLLEGGRPEG